MSFFWFLVFLFDVWCGRTSNLNLRTHVVGAVVLHPGPSIFSFGFLWVLFNNEDLVRNVFYFCFSFFLPFSQAVASIIMHSPCPSHTCGASALNLSGRPLADVASDVSPDVASDVASNVASDVSHRFGLTLASDIGGERRSRK